MLLCVRRSVSGFSFYIQPVCTDMIHDDVSQGESVKEEEQRKVYSIE